MEQVMGPISELGFMASSWTNILFILFIYLLWTYIKTGIKTGLEINTVVLCQVFYLIIDSKQFVH